MIVTYFTDIKHMDFLFYLRIKWNLIYMNQALAISITFPSRAGNTDFFRVLTSHFKFKQLQRVYVQPLLLFVSHNWVSLKTLNCIKRNLMGENFAKPKWKKFDVIGRKTGKNQKQKPWTICIYEFVYLNN